MHYSGVFARVHAEPFAAMGIAQNIVRLVSFCPCPICSGEFLPRFQDANGILYGLHLPGVLHSAMDERIQFTAGFIVWGDDECAFRSFCVLAGDFTKPLIPASNLMYAALVV